MRAILDPWLGTLAPMYVGSDPSRQALRAAVADEASPFWDDPWHARDRDACPDAWRPLSTMREPSCGVPWATRAAGSGPRVHTTTFREQTLGKSGIGILEGLLNAGPYGVPGTSDAVNNGNTSLGARSIPTRTSRAPCRERCLDAFTMTNHPSYRLTVEMAPDRLDAARIVISTGQGGNPEGRHYSDLIDDWISGRKRRPALHPRRGGGPRSPPGSSSDHDAGGRGEAPGGTSDARSLP